jgi:hypothetical protein
MRDQFYWARILSFVTGLVNQELLLRNEYLAEAAALPIREPDSPISQLILFAQVLNDLQLTLVHPAGSTNRKGSRDFSMSEVTLCPGSEGFWLQSDPVFGPYAVKHHGRRGKAKPEWPVAMAA